MDFWPSDGYIALMSAHSVAEAKNRLSSLIDRAMKGEEVVITRHGQPVVELRALLPQPKRVTREAVEWLQAHRVKPKTMGDAGKLVSEMRDEDDERL
jgi:antitoxin (DNA-binding transcriptional repressor) of toxin-antitoxin stability system